MTRGLFVASAVAIFGALTAEPRAQMPVSHCRMMNLSVRTEDVSPTTGAHPIALRIVNRAREACMLKGYPMVALRDARGTIPFVYRHGGDMMVTSRPPSPVVVGAGGSAYVLLNKFRCDLGERRVSTSVRIWLKGSPGRSRWIPTGTSIALCKPGIRAEGRVVNVSPFEATRLATLQH